MRKFLVAAVAACVLSQAAMAQLVITEVQSSSGETEDWWELTNAGNSAVDLENYYWDDNGPTGDDGAVFPAVSIGPMESIVIIDAAAGSVELDDFELLWGTGFTVLTTDQFSGPDTFSGLSSGGDQIELWDADPNPTSGAGVNRVASVSFGAAVSEAGISFEWDKLGNSLGMSVAGENGAYSPPVVTDVASPGIAVVVPEPGTMVLAAFGLLGLLGARRK